MNRKIYFDYIEYKLHTLSTRIETRGKLNLLEIHNHSEDFYLNLFNLIYGYELVNLNSESPNAASADLIDTKNKIIIQVSATSTKQKIEYSLSKEVLKEFTGYNFKFISISKDASDIRDKKYKNPFSMNFAPKKDIYDIASILNHIRGGDIDYLKRIYDFVKKELDRDVDITKLNSDLATIINILSKEPWDETDKVMGVSSFEIEEKIRINDLKNKRDIIKEYSLYHTKVDQKYSEFDSMGVNKSKAVLASIRRLYLDSKNKNDADAIFSSVIEGMKEIVLNSINFDFEKISIEELDLCVDILVVDAFIRCKIFENPEDYCYATS